MHAQHQLVARAAALFLLCLVMACGPGAAPVAQVVAFTNVDVLDARDGLRTDQVVLVSGQEITDVGPATQVQVPAGAREIDGAGATLIPGLWDAHVHFSYEPDVAPAMLPLFIANGITSVRDTGGHLDDVLPWRGLAASGRVPAPRVFVAGPLVDGSPRVYDGGAPFRPDLAISVPTPEAAVAAVDQLADAGVDLIKAYELLDPATFEAVVRRAAERGLPTTGHVPLSLDAPAAIAGLRSMEHLRNLEMACATEAESLLAERLEMLTNPDEVSGGDLRSSIHGAQRTRAVADQDPERCAALIEQLAAAGGWQVPTLTIVSPQVVRLHASEEWRDTFQYLPEPVRSNWTQGALGMAEVFPDAEMEAYVDWAMTMVGALNAADVPIMAGTDTPIFFLTPGFSLHEELALLVRAGLTEAEALAAATLEPARYFGLEDEMGGIAPGMAADLVLLEASPLDDIRNTRRIRTVMARGSLYERDDLDEMLAALERGEVVVAVAPMASAVPDATEISMPPRPEWCNDPPRATYAGLTRVASADDWFQVYEVRPGVFAIYEPDQWQEVISYLVLGQDRAVLWDTGMGIGNLRAVVDSLTDLPVVVVNSHSHYDHVGSNAAFDEVWAFDLPYTMERAEGMPNSTMRPEVVPEALCRELPDGVTADSYEVRPYRINRPISDGDIIDLGGRQLEVLAVPGHTPDAAALLDRDNGLLFTGDSFYEGPIWLFAPETDLVAYRDSMDRLAALVPELELLLPAHNTPKADPALLLGLQSALAAIEAGTAQAEVGERARRFDFDGFSILLALERD